MDETGSLHQGKGCLISEFFAFVVSSKNVPNHYPQLFLGWKSKKWEQISPAKSEKTILLIFLFKLLSVELFSNHGNGFQVFSSSARPVEIYGDGWNLPQLKPVHNCSHSYILLPPLKVILSRQKIQTAVETDKFTKVHQKMAMFDSVCNWHGFYSESCLRFALEKHC